MHSMLVLLSLFHYTDIPKSARALQRELTQVYRVAVLVERSGHIQASFAEAVYRGGSSKEKERGSEPSDFSPCYKLNRLSETVRGVFQT